MRWLCSAVVLLSAFCFAQDRQVSVCVGMPGNSSRMMVNDSFQRNRLVQFINGVGKQKKAKVKVSAIAVESSTLDDAISEARSTGCQFALVSEFGSSFGSFLPPAGPIAPLGPASRSARRNANLSYSLASTEDGVPFQRAVVPIDDISDDDSVFQAIRDVGDRVVKDIARRRPKAGD